MVVLQIVLENLVVLVVVVVLQIPVIVVLQVGQETLLLLVPLKEIMVEQVLIQVHQQVQIQEVVEEEAAVVV